MIASDKDMDLPPADRGHEDDTPRAFVRPVIGLPFVTAVVLLGIAVVLSGPVAGWMNLRLAKEPIQLRRPLDALDAHNLRPYRVVNRQILDAAIEEALGTSQYVSWTLEDTRVKPGDPLRFAHLFITYYTGGGSLVPHTPDVCYLGAGYQPAQPHENMELRVSSLDLIGRKLPVRVCTFAKTAIFDHQQMSVVYTFHCNGRFAATRTRVRILLNDPAARFAYFSKVEASFLGATRAETVEGAKKLFTRILPLLVEYHWPDIEETNRRAVGNHG